MALLFACRGTRPPEALAGRLRAQYPRLALRTGSNDPAGWDVVVNATPLGMNPGDPIRRDHLRQRSQDRKDNECEAKMPHDDLH